MICGKTYIKLFFLIAFIFLFQVSFSQVVSNDPPVVRPDSITSENIPLTLKENVLSILLLTMMIIVVLFEFSLVKRMNMTEGNTIKLIVVTIVIFCAIFLVTAGYFEEKLAPAFGLLGTIAGYLLGKTDNDK